MADQLIDRRNALKYVSLLTATAAGREFLAGWLPSARDLQAATAPSEAAKGHGSHLLPAAEQTKPYTPQFFKPDEFRTVEMLTEIIIPTDDTPGAKEARVADYIDFVVFSAAEHFPEMQERWTEGLSWLDQASRKSFGTGFKEISPAQREQLLTEMSRPERDPRASYAGYSFYRLVKGMTVEGFYTSRVGLIDVLGFQGLAFLPEFPGCTHPEHH